MNIKSGFVLLIVLIAGVLGGTAAYQVATPASSSAEPAARDSLVVNKTNARSQGRGFLPCKRPATLQGGRCVTEVTRTVVVPGAPVAPATSASNGRGPAPAPVPVDTSGDDHEVRHHGGEGESGHHGDDDADDDDGDDTDFTDASDDHSHGHHGGDDDSHGGDDDSHGDDDDSHGDDGGTHTRTHD